MSTNDTVLNAKINKIIGTQFLIEFNRHRNETSQLQLIFSMRWAETTRELYGLRFRHVHYEAISANVILIANQMSHICMVIMTFAGGINRMPNHPVYFIVSRRAEHFGQA